MIYTYTRSILKTLFYYSLSLTEKRTFQNLEIYVTSHGGVGTSFLGDYISRFSQVNDPYNVSVGLCKHLPIPPLRGPSNIKTIYIFGDPCEATISLFRRKYAHLQACKNGSFAPISDSESLDDYICIGKDRLGLTKNFVSWLNTIQKHNSYLFINYDHLWENIDILQSYLELNQDFKNHFPKKVKRHSNLDSFDTFKLNRLKGIYKNYYDLMSKIGSYAIYN